MDFETYERERRSDYADFAAVIAAILTAAIRSDESLRLQQVKHRAKGLASLKKKLVDRNLLETVELEDEIKDLAGCRTIFYTNTDVTRFIGSGIIHDNFEVLETKLHYPQRDAEDANELYISNHYLVRLRPERLALPEYHQFAGMRCEIQVQTILNHAWAEMAHDTIYKTPPLGRFGANALDAVQRRLARVARKYLLPAGHEFDKIANDFQQLMEGKRLFDEGALEAIVAAEDNNTRADALAAFAENVLPYYNDVRGEYHRIVERLVEAVRIARTTAPVHIDTPYGALPPKTSADIVEGVASILATYRYADVEVTFDTLCKLFADADNDAERKSLLNTAERLAKHELNVWREYGPAVQQLLVDRIEDMPLDTRGSAWRLLARMLGEILKPDVTGATGSSNSVTLHRGAVVVSDTLRTVRTKAIDLLKGLMAFADSDIDRREILSALEEATHTPSMSGYSNDLARLVVENTRTLVEYETEIATTLSFEMLQDLEERALRTRWNYSDLPATMNSDVTLINERDKLQSAILVLRDKINSSREFVVYKTLVGFDSVFPPAWDDPEFDHKKEEQYRAALAEALLDEVDEESKGTWFNTLSRCAQTQSNDAATFPTFDRFIRRLGETKPDILIDYMRTMAAPLARFVPAMLAGLMKSARADVAQAFIDEWLRDGRYLADIAWYMRLAEPFDEGLLRRLLDSAIADDDTVAVRNVLLAAEMQFKSHPGSLIANVFLPALAFLAKKSDVSWIRMPWFSWLDSPLLEALDEDQAEAVLNALVPYPELKYDAEDIAATLAKRWPGKVIDFFGDRLAYARRGEAVEGYRDLPYDVHDLQEPLAAAQDLLVEAARGWFAREPNDFRFGGGHFLAAVFPDFPDDFESRLTGIIGSGDREDLAFVLGILSNYEGREATHGLVKDIIAEIAADDPLMGDVWVVIGSTGGTSGEFGWVNLLTTRKSVMEGWLSDSRDRVRAFAEAYIRDLDRQIASEQRRAEASIALRKLDYDEELDDQD